MSARRTVSGREIEVTEGDVTRQDDVDAVVNAANAELRPGGGVAGAIHRAAGPELAEECRTLAPIRPGDCVLTGAHQLPNRFVLHCLGPVYGVDAPSDDLLASCYRQALDIAEQRGIRSVAFPAISTGAFGYPMREAADIALSTVLVTVAGLDAVRLVRFVLRGDQAVAAHEEALEQRAR